MNKVFVWLVVVILLVLYYTQPPMKVYNELPVIYYILIPLIGVFVMTLMMSMLIWCNFIDYGEVVAHVRHFISNS